MEKNVIEVVLQPEVKEEKESILLLLFRKKRVILFVTLIGLIIGLVVSFAYYSHESKRVAAISNVQQPAIISESLYDRQFLMQPTREREPGNLYISEQLRYDVFLVNKTMSDVVIHLSQNNHTAIKTAFESFQGLAMKKLALIAEFPTQHLMINTGTFTTKIDDYVTQYPYLMINDDKSILQSKILENQSLIDTYNLAITNTTNNVDYHQILINIKSLNQINKVLEEIIQGNTANNPDWRGTHIASAYIEALCETVDEVKLELLNTIDKYSSPAPIPGNALSLKYIAIVVIFPCMAFIAAVLIVMLLDWWHDFIKEQGNL